MNNVSGKITISKVSVNNGDDFVQIQIKDTAAVQTFLRVHVELENFAKAILGLGHIDCTFDYDNLDRIGKARDQSVIKFPLPPGTRVLDDYREVALSIVDKYTPTGWIADKSFSSADSFRVIEGTIWVKTNIFRWVGPNVSRSHSKVNLGHGSWEITYCESLESNETKVETVDIGCNGNWVFTDHNGTRYVPIIGQEITYNRGFENFGPQKYLRITSWGDVYYVLEAKCLN